MTAAGSVLAERVVAAVPRDSGGPHPELHQVPEIDASAGLLALAAVATVLLLAWERNRRA